MMLEIVPDSAFELAPYGFWRCSFRDTPDADQTIFFDPHNGEQCGNVIFLKAKLLCEQRNWRLVGVGAMNQFSLFSLFCDEVLLADDRAALDGLYSEATACYTKKDRLYECLRGRGWRQQGAWTHSDDHSLMMDGKATPRCAPWLADAATIPNELVVSRFTSPTVHVRQSSVDLFDSLDLPRNVLACEFKESPASRQAGPLLDRLGIPFVGFDRNFQRDLLARVGPHYMSIQYLASLRNNWVFGCFCGASNLFCMLPVKALFLASEAFIFSSEIVTNCLRALYTARYGEIGLTIPFLGQDFLGMLERERGTLSDGFRHLISLETA